jgi:hypothetical protein
MGGITLAYAEAKFTAASEAYDKALNSHSYSHGGSQVTFDMRRQKLADLQAAIDKWDDHIKRLSDVGPGIIAEQYSPDHTT